MSNPNDDWQGWPCQAPTKKVKLPWHIPWTSGFFYGTIIMGLMSLLTYLAWRAW